MQRAGWQMVVLCKMFATWLLLYFNKDFILVCPATNNLQDDDTQFIYYVKSFYC
jgi:hypothetical protein